MNRYRIAVALVIALVTIGAFGFYIIFRIPNLECISDSCVMEIRSERESQDPFQQTGIKLSNTLTWSIACRLKRLEFIKPGRYKFLPGMSNRDVINVFRSGGESTVTIRIDDITNPEALAGRLGHYLLHDSAYFHKAFTDDSLLSVFGTDQLLLATIIRPNTYEFYWNMTAESFLKRMKIENDKFWTQERTQACESMQLSKTDAIILASIVKAETAALSEAPRIAGLYLNRLRIGMPLQSDPTAIFGRQAKTQRVYLSDIQSDNPYNTYRFQGLPPGPINFPEASYIDAVLKPEVHSYIYMCAEPGGTGRHRFAKTLQEHERNRRLYVDWLDSAGIR